MSFRFHSKRDTPDEFFKTESTHKNDLIAFEKFAEYETLQSGNTFNDTSGKASSYYRYMISLIINYENNFNNKIVNLISEDTYSKLNRLFERSEFIAFNKQKNSFYSASLKCLERFILFNNKYSEDEVINILSDTPIENEAPLPFSLTPKNLPQTSTYTTSDRILRDATVARDAKIRSGWKCEFNHEHRTFTHAITLQNYIEAHHLIPMFAQSDFLSSIDIDANIICLCPNCHRQIHHGTNTDKLTIVTKLYQQREHLFSQYQIDISLEKLLEYYGIKS